MTKIRPTMRVTPATAELINEFLDLHVTNDQAAFDAATKNAKEAAVTADQYYAACAMTELTSSGRQWACLGLYRARKRERCCDG